MRQPSHIVISTLVALILGGSDSRGQQPRTLSVGASGAGVSAWALRVDDMLHNGALDISIVQTDTMISGRTHERLAQRYLGLPVFGGELVRQMDGVSVVSVFGTVFQNVAVPTVEPAISAAAAAAAAQRAAGEGANAGEAVLGILPLSGAAGTSTASGTYVLAYKMTVRSAWDIQTYFVNAATGAIEAHNSRIHSDTPVSGTGNGVLNDLKKISVNKTSAGFEAVDLQRPAQAYTLDFHGSAARFNTFFQTGIVNDSDIAVSRANPWTDGAVVDAHVYQGLVYDYYYRRFGRHGLDDHDIPIVGIVHPLARRDIALYSSSTVGQFINNAEYIGDGFMLYGDGDGRSLNYLSGALDVIGHELTHGVTDFTSQLEYHDESGALNEAFSDIMGTSVEYFFERLGQGPQKGPNFLMGEDVTLSSPGFVRSLQNPNIAGDPDHYSLRRFLGTTTDEGGVHFNSTIVSHAFFLAVAGGTNRVSGVQVQGVGVNNRDRMERIFYRAFAFLMGPKSQFTDARAATLQAATDLYGANGNERGQLLQAWTAVGVQ